MKFYLILGLLCVGAYGEQKINLEDIERDNLRVEGLSKYGNMRSEEARYQTKPKFAQQSIEIPNQYHAPNNAPVSYVTPSPLQNQAQESYVQPHRYAVKEQSFQQANNAIHNIVPNELWQRFLRRYNEYKQQPPVPPKGNPPNVFQSQLLTYQPEVNVGNQLQSVQQKSVSAKYAKNTNKELFIDIPTMHILNYYPNLDVNSGKGAAPQLTTAPTSHISIPLYTSTLNQKPIESVRPRYQNPDDPKYNTAPITFTPKVPKSVVSGSPVLLEKYVNPPLPRPPLYASQDQSAAQGRQFLYTQANIAPVQPQYVSQLVYALPAMVYMHATPVYSDAYERPPGYDQDNFLQGNVKYTAPPEQLQSEKPVADEVPNQVLGQQSSQSVTQNYVKDAEKADTDSIAPDTAPQDFKFDAPLAPPVSMENETVPEQNRVGSTEPRSLLESYVPSKLIAAHDTVRYQERPIKLEGGFLPSKDNFAYKNRKVN